jgi:hypothetical protein
LHKASELDLGPSSLLFNGYLASLPGVKQLKHEVDHSTASSAKLGTSGAIHSLPYIPSWHGPKSFYFSIPLFHILDTCRLRFTHTQVKGQAVLTSDLKSLYYTFHKDVKLKMQPLMNEKVRWSIRVTIC